ncbi:MAG: tetratricopeptide repeat protein [Planctomycetota bacterium]
MAKHVRTAWLDPLSKHPALLINRLPERQRLAERVEDYLDEGKSAQIVVSGDRTAEGRVLARAQLAAGLRTSGRWEEAEGLLREALALADSEGVPGPELRSRIVRHLALGLEEHGRWEEAEPLFREALRLAEGSLPAHQKALGALADGLRAHGREDEARALEAQSEPVPPTESTPSLGGYWH